MKMCYEQLLDDLKAFAEEDFAKFQEMKYNDDKRWNLVQNLYRNRFALQERLDYVVNGEKMFIPQYSKLSNVKTIAGAGSKTVLRVAERLAEKHGGSSSEWKKKVGKIESDKYMFDIHWYELNGKQYEAKVKERREKD